MFHQETSVETIKLIISFTSTRSSFVCFITATLSCRGNECDSTSLSGISVTGGTADCTPWHWHLVMLNLVCSTQLHVLVFLLPLIVLIDIGATQLHVFLFSLRASLTHWVDIVFVFQLNGDESMTVPRTEASSFTSTRLSFLSSIF